MKGFRNITGNKLQILLTALILLFCKPVFSQQETDPVYSQYMNNLMSINPAYTAVRGVGNISGVFRNQWVNLGPMTSSLTFSMPIDSFHMGLGADFLYDNTKAMTTTGLFLNYSYKIKATESSMISFGLKAGVNYLQANLDELYRHDYDDEYILKYGDDYRRVLFNTGVGIFWYSRDFYAGISVPRLIENRYIKEKTVVEANSREKQHYFIQGAYMIDLSKDVSFKPGIMTIMTAGAPLTADFDFSFMFYEKLWFGVVYRISDAIGAYAQFQYQNMKIGFSYDYTHNRLREFQNGTFEVMVRFDFKTKETQLFPGLTF